MDSQSIPSSSRNPSQLSWMNLSRNLLLAYQSFGVVYGDLSTSPLYVYTSTFKGKLKDHHDEETIFGVFSLIFWTITLIPLLKYVFIILSANDNGEGGTFALYSLLCRHAKFNLLPNQQAADEELSSYKYGPSSQTGASSPLKIFLEKHKRLRTVLLVVVLFGACMVIGDGVLSPAISVLASVSGLKVTITKFNNGELVLLACVILVGMFALQHCGTHRIAFMFAPIVIIWLLSIFIIGIYNTILWNPKIVFAISPHYIIQFFIKTGTEGWISLGGILLCITGAEAMFADLGHFTATSIRLAFAVVIYPCLVMQYMGQAAFLSKNLDSIQNSFYDSIPEPVFWPVFVIATMAAIVGSQASITATFSIIKQCHALDCFPRVKVVHTSKHMFGQIYIPEINWILMVLTLAVTIGFQDTTLIGNAYGLACMTVMFVTTFLMALVIVFVWQKSIVIAALFLLFFWVVEAVYLSAAFLKVHQGGWVPLVLSFFFLVVMYVWHYGIRRKYKYDLHNKVSLKWLLGLGPSLGIVRVPGIGLIYSELATGIPAIFTHFVTNLPAFHKVLVFVCVKSVPVPHVSPEERFLIGRACPRPFRMYRCIVRYGYKDIKKDDGEFENHLIQSIMEFIQMEAVEPQFSSSDSSFDARMAVIGTRSLESTPTLIASEQEDVDIDESIPSSKSITLRRLQSTIDDENPQVRRRRVKFQVPNNPRLDNAVKEEILDLIQAKEAGGHSLDHLLFVQFRICTMMKKSTTILTNFKSRITHLLTDRRKPNLTNLLTRRFNSTTANDPSIHDQVIDFPGGNVKFIPHMRFLSESAQDRIPCYRVLDHNGDQISGTQSIQVNEDVAVKMYNNMVALQTMDTIFYEAQRQGRISFYLTSSGEEAINIASAAALSMDDIIFPQYREQGVLLWRGFTLQEFANQCFSNKFDNGKGRQMPIHYGSNKHNYVTVSSTIATQIPHAVGAAYSLKMDKKDACAVTYFGDGGSSEGDFHAGLNFAAVMEAPVIFICRNNGWAISTPTSDQFRSDGIVVKGQGYGIRSIRVDGNDALAIYSAVQAARELAVSEKRPILIEALTYRAGHHSTSDDSTKYRPAKEIDWWRSTRDPVARFRKWIERNGWWNDITESELRNSLRQQLLQTILVAERAEKPPLADLFTDVYDAPPSNLREQEKWLKETVKKHPHVCPTNVPV